jgi:hypothetical protein
MRTQDRQPWHESDNPSTVVRGATWRGGLWLLAVVVIALVIGGIVWGINTLVAEPKGRGDAYRNKESGVHRVFAQEAFEKRYADIEATRAKIRTALQVPAADRTGEQEIRLEGLRSYCATVTGDYNAAARSYSQQDFRAADLPARLDATTDCEPTP